MQQLALRTDDELHSITELRRRGVDFLTIPEAYYQTVWSCVNKMLTEHGHQIVEEDHTRVKDFGILVDADDEGYLLQLFTKLLQDRPMLFFEIICRRGSQSLWQWGVLRRCLRVWRLSGRGEGICERPAIEQRRIFQPARE